MGFRLLPTAALVVSLWITIKGTEASAQVDLQRFFPAAVAAGQSTQVKAEGKFPKWPPEVVCDRPDIEVVPLESSGELKITPAVGSAPGVAWIRLLDAQSASKLVPLMIEEVPTSVETEPNNRTTEATAIQSPAVVNGRFEKSGDIDTFQIAARAGQTLVLSITANRVLRSPMDTVMQLADDQGNVLAQTDDSRGLDPQLVFPVSRDGDFLIRVFAFPETPNSTIGYAGDASYVYVLRATTGGSLDHVLPLSGSDDSIPFQPEGWNLAQKPLVRRIAASGISPVTLSVENALGWQWQSDVATKAASFCFDGDDPTHSPETSQLPFVFSGHIGEPGEIDRIRFPVTNGKRYAVSVESKRLGFLLDSVIRLVDPVSGEELARNDDRNRNDYDAGLEYQAKTDGSIELQVSDLVDGYGTRHAYSVLVTEAIAGAALEVSSDRFTLAPGASTEIPITVTRRNGYDAKLEIAAIDLPPGVTAEIVVSEAKGDSAKSVKLKLSAGQEARYQGIFHIVARTIDADGEKSSEPILAGFTLREEITLTNLWLTVPEVKKEG